MAFSLDRLKNHLISTDETGNSTKTLLTSSATYTGAWEDVTDYSTVAVALIGSLATDGTLYIESSQDGGTVVNSVPYTITDASFQLPIVWNVVESHIRIKYVNGTTAMTGTFQLQTKYSNAQELGLSQSAGDTINTNTACQVTKAIATGTDPNAAYQNQVVAGVDDGNSSTATLGISAVFTGVWQDLSGYAGISCLVDGTSAGTADGVLEMQFSHDGSTVHRNISVSYADITATAPKTLGVVAKYFRVIYTNGTTATTSFDLQTMLHTEQVALVSRLSGTMTDNTDVADTRAVVMGREPDGSYSANPHDGVAFTNTSTLTAASVYTSSWVATSGYNSIELFIDADVISANQGIVVDYTTTIDSPSVDETKSYSFRQHDIDHGGLDLFLEPRLTGFRITYTNGATNQSSFTMQVDLRANGTTNVHNDGGALMIADFQTEVALGNVNNYDHGEMIGATRLIDAADGEVTVWEASDDDNSTQILRKTWKTTAVQMWIASTSASDTTKDITITYNDSNNELAEVTITLTGTTAVDSGVTALDIAHAYVSSDDDTLVGVVTIQQGSAFTAGVPDDITDVLGTLSSRYQQFMGSCFRVPSNKKADISHILIQLQRAGGVAGAGGANLWIKEPSKSWRVIRPYLLGTSQTVDTLDQIVVPAGSFIELTQTAPSDTDTHMTSVIEYTLVSE